MLNTVALHGRLTADPELKRTPNDIPVVNFSLAVNSGSGDKQTVAYIDCVGWRKTAEFICKYFSKGEQMNLTGALRTRSYEDRNGTKRKVTEVLAREVDFCGSKSSKATKPARSDNSRSNAPAPSPAEYGPDDDLPF